VSNRIYVNYGQDPGRMVQEILTHMQIERSIPENALIGIKPNLVVAKPSTSGATTSPALVGGIIEYLKAKGRNNIVILESSWIGERTSRAFEVCGYNELALKYGVQLIDLQRDSCTAHQAGGMEIAVCDAVTRLDYLINVPVLKGHCQTKITCALKNLKGCIPNSEKRRFHTMGLHKPIAYLNKIIRTDLVIVDGIMGDLDFEEGGNPVQMDMVLAGRDPVLVDSYVAGLLGYAPEEIGYLRIAESIGVGSFVDESTEVIELNKEYSGMRGAPTRKIERLAQYVDEKDACSACYGSLIRALARLDEQGLLGQIPGKIHIGQGYRGKSGTGIGVGACARGFAVSVRGCPPTAREIIEAIARIVQQQTNLY
jgi:uncharacterized protein (DUF362 family)